MIATVDKGHIGVFALLDLSAAFDTVDHVILMETLRSIRRIGLAYVGGDALGWLADYLNGRRQVVREASSESITAVRHSARISARPQNIHRIR